MKPNIKVNSNRSATGLRGVRVVTEHKATHGASVRHNGLNVWLGTYNTPEEATAARVGFLTGVGKLGRL